MTEKEKAWQMCDCENCEKEISEDCKYKGKYKRLPREFYIGALNLCPKIQNEHF